MSVTTSSPTTTYLYNNRVTVEFDPAGHRYLVAVDGAEPVTYPSVTTILSKLDKSEPLIRWATAEMGRRLLELFKASEPDNLLDPWHQAWLIEHARDSWRKTRQTAADIGTVVHDALHRELLTRSGHTLTEQTSPYGNLPESLWSQADAAIAAGLQFFDEHSIEILQAESPRFSQLHGYIGTGDLIALIDGIPSVLDYKTSKHLYSTVWLQTAAYQQAWQEEFPDSPLAQRVAVNVRKDGTLETQTRDNSDFDCDLSAFLGLRAVWYWQESGR